DAYPGRTFRGKVIPQGTYAARLNASMNQNVVTYTVVVSADTSDKGLYPLLTANYPYLTANLQFIIADKRDALLAPNAALRWSPSPPQIAPDARADYAKLKGRKRSPLDGDASDTGFVWVKDEDGYVRPIAVRTGYSDTVNTEVVEVLSGELREG